MPHVVWAMAVTLTVPAAFASLGPPAPPAGPGESIPTYDVVLTVRNDGVLHVRETITYDFHDRREHGIVRRVPYRVGDRLYDIRNVRASSSTGAPARARATRVLHDLRIAVGGGRRKVSGRQAYVVEYDVVGALTAAPGRAELRWDAVGTGWGVPIGEVSVRVHTPARPLGVRCRAGAHRRAGPGLTECGRGRAAPRAVEFTQRDLRPRESVLIDVHLPEGAVEVPAPRYARPHFAFSRLGYVLSALCLAVGLALALAARLARSERPAAAIARRLAAGGAPGRRTGALLLATGAAAVVWDLADDVVAHGLWAASVGDPALAGMGLLALGAAIGAHGRRSGRPGCVVRNSRSEHEASGDHRA